MIQDTAAACAAVFTWIACVAGYEWLRWHTK
jgi:hypothetical protein